MGQEQKLSEEILKLGIDNLEVRDGTDLYNATIGSGCLRIKCCELFDMKSLELPWWKKEVPAPARSEASTSPPQTPLPLRSPGSTASTPSPPASGNGGADLGEVE